MACYSTTKSGGIWNNEHEEHFKGCRRHGKEIAGDDIFDMVAQKGFPRRRGGFASSGSVFLYRRFSHIDTELVEFADNARRTPRGIGSPHILDELADFSGNGGSPRFPSLAETSPVIPEPFLLPGDNGTRLDERQRLLPVRPQARELGPKEAIGRPELRARATLLIDRDLVAQGNKFHLHGETRPEPGRDGGNEDYDDGWHDQQPYLER